MKEIILTTTSKISGETAAFLTEEVKKAFGSDNIIRKTDDGIIGGFTVKYDGLFYDMSIASQLSSMRETLKKQEAGQ